MPKGSPILVRIFKEEAELEVWKQDESGRFALLKTYPICRWSGELGPKIRQGDRQAPEGFYTITPGQMNPNSSYYLSFNLGFPNAYDRANDRTGSFLMVHGDCSSAGCYAMTDEQIAEIYALGRDSFFGGQKSFQVQAYPFHMTPLNMAKHRNNPAMPFWRMIKQGYDHFEVSRLEPKVDVCEKRYVFDAVAPGGASTPLNFSPRGACPAYEVRQDIAAAAKQKQERDEREFAEYVARGVQTVAFHTGVDGGMNPVFASKYRAPDTFDDSGHVRPVLASAPPAVPPSVSAPRAPEESTPTTGSVAEAKVPLPRTAPQRKSSTAFASAAAGEEPSLTNKLLDLFSSNDSPPAPSRTAAAQEPSTPIDRMSKWIGLHGDDASAAKRTPAPSAPKPKPVQTASAPHTSAPAGPRPAATKPAVAKPAVAETPSAETPAAAAEPQPAPQPSEAVAQAGDRPAKAAAASEPLMKGAQPVLPSMSFDSRWSAFR
ncbi:MAG TPA: L,D-transpeptidase family protein [Xanthobacteraceae bacterium]|nr:L,D-transpeptidase family protein [Xanthobacteraceae bacterium]